MNTLQQEYYKWCFSKKFSDYNPSKVNHSAINRWLKQYDKSDRKLLVKLLQKIIYFSEKDIDSFLQKKNEELLSKLNADNITNKKIIYITIDETASSSHVILNKARDLCRLEKKGCKLIDSRDLLGLNRVINKIGFGAIVYVDDFIGSGDQFCRSRDYIANNIRSLSLNFSEFLLAPCICQEAVKQLTDRGVVPYTNHIHVIDERILHKDNEDRYLTRSEKERLIELSYKIDKHFPLGYKNLATMVVMYRNSPTSTPYILRGNAGQNKFVGIFPRTTDLPTN